MYCVIDTHLVVKTVSSHFFVHYYNQLGFFKGNVNNSTTYSFKGMYEIKLSVFPLL